MGWKDLGGKLVNWLRSKSPTYKQTYKNSHKQKTRGVGLATALVVYSNDPLAKWKDKGRKAGGFPPPAAMLAYVKFRGLRVAGSKSPVASQQKAIAFLIGRKIGRGNMGPKRPNLYPDRVVNENRATISGGIKRLSAEIAAQLNR